MKTVYGNLIKLSYYSRGVSSGGVSVDAVILEPATNATSGKWTATDIADSSQTVVNGNDIERFIACFEDVDAEPCPSRFGYCADTVSLHFDSCSSGYSAESVVDLSFDDKPAIRFRAHFGHVHSLPWHRDDLPGYQNYNPEVSIAFAKLLPRLDRSMGYKDDLLAWDEKWRLEWEAEERADEQREAVKEEAEADSAFDSASDLLKRFFNITDSGLETPFDPNRTNYTANQLKQMSFRELQQLADAGFDLSTSDEHAKQTALMYAAFPPFNLEQFNNLVDAGAEIDARRSDSMTGLMLACSGGMNQEVDYWIDAGADIHLLTDDGATTLMLGAAWPPIVERLLELGIDPATVDSEGATALDYAIHKQWLYGVPNDYSATEDSEIDLSHVLRHVQFLTEVTAQKAPDTIETSLQLARKFAHEEKLKKHVAVKIRFPDEPTDCEPLQRIAKYAEKEIKIADGIVAIIEATLSQAKL